MNYYVSCCSFVVHLQKSFKAYFSFLLGPFAPKIVSGFKGDFNGYQPLRVAANLLWILSRMASIGRTELPTLSRLRQLAEVWTFLIAHSIIVTVPFSMRLRFLQQGKDLLPFHTGETFEKFCNGVTRPRWSNRLIIGTRVPVKTGSPREFKGPA
jgi:hypothetical protein